MTQVVDLVTETPFFTSDTHFWHDAMIRIGLRQFATVQEMNETLIARWNAVVPPTATVFHLGDVSFAGTVDTLEVLGQLNGRIILIRGNHDKKLPVAVRQRFTSIHDLLEIDVKEGGGTKQRITLLHYAMRVWNRHHYGAWHLHGHSHGSLVPTGRSMDVGVDVHDLAPISYGEVKEELVSRAVHIVDHHATP